MNQPSGSQPSMDVVRSRLLQGLVIPAHPLALTSARQLDETYQRGLTRYYHASGAGGIAVGVHTTQFEIRHPRHGLLRPVLDLASRTIVECDRATNRATLRIAGVCGSLPQAIREAQLAKDLGYDVGLVSLRGMTHESDDHLVAHCRAVMEVIPVMGFYLQPAVGGRPLSYLFWRRLAELPGLVGIKIAPFNRYQTLDVLRAVRDSGRTDVALYTGNDDNILLDLLSPAVPGHGASLPSVRFVGGLLGQWAVWTSRAVSLLDECHRLQQDQQPISPEMFRLALELTDANGALFDAANGFRGCIAGIHEALRRQGLMKGIWCLDPEETLGSGQLEEMDRVWAAYPHLRDDEFIARHLHSWLS